MRMFYCTEDINNAEVVYARRNLNSEDSGNCHIFYIYTPEVIATCFRPHLFCLLAIKMHALLHMEQHNAEGGEARNLHALGSAAIVSSSTFAMVPFMQYCTRHIPIIIF
jgi:hypothetical protein